MARNGSLQYLGGYCYDVSHYRDAILLGTRSYRWQRWRGRLHTAIVGVAVSKVGVKRKKKKKKKNTKVGEDGVNPGSQNYERSSAEFRRRRVNG